MIPSTLTGLEVRVEEYPHFLDPLRVYRALPGPNRVLLESSDSRHEDGQFSFVTTRPGLWLETREGVSILKDGRGREIRRDRDVVSVIREVLAEHAVTLPGTDFPPLVGGWIGSFSYDLGRTFERIPMVGQKQITFPDVAVGFYSSLIAIDHHQRRSYRVDLLSAGEPIADPETVRLLDDAVRGSSPIVGGRRTGTDRSVAPPVSDISRSEYLQAVEKIKKHIAAGDVYQVNFSQRFTTTWNGSSDDLYERLRTVNPSPFAALLEQEKGAVLSASPERFFELRSGRVVSRPIKGTCARGRDAADDRIVAEALLQSEKDGAELTMIVDLIRNDLGRVCRFGTVQVDRDREIEFHPTVVHLVATVSGTLMEGKDGLDLLMATFPGGSITGAPKIRAMELIEELEPRRRGVYTGSVGYFGVDGSVDLNIAIRTLLLEGNEVSYSVGGGIVADSDPEAEFLETLDKGRGILRALGYEDVSG